MLEKRAKIPINWSDHRTVGPSPTSWL